MTEPRSTKGRRLDPLGDGRGPIKTDIIRLHLTLYGLRMALIKRGILHEGAFPKYDAIGVRPQHVNRARGAHQKAILALGEDLQYALHIDEPRRDRL